MGSATKRRAVIAAAAVAMSLFSAAGTSPAPAATSTVAALPPTGAGIDVSFPQCAAGSHVDLPANVPFAIVGVNGGKASTINRCFQSEYNSALLLAGLTEQPHASVYVNTGNPSLAATWWPSDNRTQSGSAVFNPNGTCAHKAGAACAYVYGYSMAQADYRRVRRLWRPAHLWWLDVETTNSWQYADVTANAATLSGMVDYFEGKGLTVGIYSTSYQWKKIAGVSSATSDLAGLPSWLAGGSQFGAPADCEKSPLTPGGRVVLVQYVMEVDNDFSCHVFPGVGASISPAASVAAGTVLTAISGRWAASGVSYTYAWSRDGHPIPDATGRTYTAAASDLDAAITVTITGRKSAYSTMSATSSPVTVLDTLKTANVAISGSPSSGHLLTVKTGSWGPGAVGFSYSWYRGTTLVSSGASATSYFLTSADAGQIITVTVTGSKPGFAPASESASSARIQP
jgi:hypothetical protein